MRRNGKRLPGLLLGVMDGGSLERRVMRLIEAPPMWAQRWRVASAVGCFVVMVAVCVGGMVFGVRATLAQGGLPTFEAASIKPTDPNGRYETGVHVYPGGRLVIHAVPLKSLIVYAFNLSYWQISGGDGWMEKTQYEVEANPPESWRAKLPNGQYSIFGIRDEPVRQMLQALLTERFQLKFHRDTKTGMVYVLEKSGKPIALRTAMTDLPKNHTRDGLTINGEVSRIDNSDWFLFNTSMPQLARYISTYVVRRPVLDRTGLDGSYDFEYKLMPTEADNAVPVGAPADLSSFLMVVPKMGLQLKQAEGPVESFVIDSAQRPTEN